MLLFFEMLDMCSDTDLRLYLHYILSALFGVSVLGKVTEDVNKSANIVTQGIWVEYMMLKKISYFTSLHIYREVEEIWTNDRIPCISGHNSTL